VNLLGEIKKIVPEAGVPSVTSGQALQQTQDKLTDTGLKSG
jgi:hypothetical protein